MDERFIKRLLATMKCTTCNKHFEPGHINVLGHQKNVWFFSVYCTSCQNQGLVAAVIKNGNNSEIITDLTSSEFAKFLKGSTITPDDILDMHQFLVNFDGDFSSIFKNGTPK